MHACSASLASLTRDSGPKVVKGDPARRFEGSRVAHVPHHRHAATPTISVSDSALKFTHVLYNLSPAGFLPILFFSSLSFFSKINDTSFCTVMYENEFSITSCIFEMNWSMAMT